MRKGALWHMLTIELQYDTFEQQHLNGRLDEHALDVLWNLHLLRSLPKEKGDENVM